MRRRRVAGVASLAGVLVFGWGLPGIVALVESPEAEERVGVGDGSSGAASGGEGAVAQAGAGDGDIGAEPDDVPRLAEPILDATGDRWLLVPDATDQPPLGAEEVVGVLRAAEGSADVVDLRFLLAQVVGAGESARRLVWVTLDATRDTGDAGAVLALHDAVTGEPLPLRGPDVVARSGGGAASPSTVPSPAAAPQGTPPAPAVTPSDPEAVETGDSERGDAGRVHPGVPSAAPPPRPPAQPELPETTTAGTRSPAPAEG